MTRLKPLGTNIIVKRIDPEAISEGGIVLPGVAQKVRNVGTVVAVGDLAVDNTMKPLVAVGDRVIFASFASQTIEHQKQEYIILGVDDVLCVEVEVADE
jgi:chaperonin GroES